MQRRENRMVQQHFGARIDHYFARGLAHGGVITMHRAFYALWLAVSEHTFFETIIGIAQKLSAFLTKRITRHHALRMLIRAVDLGHSSKSQRLTLKSFRATIHWHNRKSNRKSQSDTQLF